MGKVLVINGADFKEVNVSSTPLFVNGKYILKEDNYQHKFVGYITENNTWRNLSDNNYLLWKVNKGNIIFIKPSIDNKAKFALVKEVPYAKDSPVIYMEGDDNPIVLEANNAIAGRKATEDGFIAVYSLTDGTNIFPELAKINLEDNRGFNLEDKVYGTNLYIRTDNYFGGSLAPEGETSAVFYHVFRGDSITIKANNKTNVALLDYSTVIRVNGLAKFMDGENLKVVEEGETITLNVPHDGWLYVLAWDVDRFLFPQITLNE